MLTASPSPFARRALVFAAACVVVISAGCEVVSSKSKQDTTTLVTTATSVAGADTSAASGVPAAPPESLAMQTLRDSGVVTLFPDRPVRGGVLFALAEGVASDIPR